MLVDLEWILSPTREIYPPPGVLVSELPGLTEVVKRGQDRRQHPEAMYVAFPGEGDGLGRETFFVLFVDMDVSNIIHN